MKRAFFTVASLGLEHFTFYCRLDLQSLNHALALSGVM
jgi:hypothetical protein